METFKKYGLIAVFVGALLMQSGIFCTKEEMRSYAETTYVQKCQFDTVIKELEYIRSRVDNIYEKLSKEGK